MSITVVLVQMIKLFLIMCIGYSLYKLGVVDNHTKGQLTKIILYVTTPCLIINSFVENMGGDNRGIIANVFVIAIIMYLILPIIGIIVTLILKVKKAQKGVYIFMTVFANVGFMGFPVVDALYGSEGVFYTAVFNCIFNIYAFTLGVILMTYGKEGSDDSISSLIDPKKMLNPGTLGCFVAIIIFVLNIPLHVVLKETFSAVGGLTSTFAMMLVGISLASMNVKEMLGEFRVYIYTIIKQFVLPIALWPVVSYYVENKVVAAVTLLMLAMPVGNISVLFATEYGGDEKTAAKGVFLSTLVSLVSIPLVVWWCL